MTIRERVHAEIDRLPETELRELAKRLDVLDEAEAESRDDDLAETIAMWKALAEPIEDEEARRAFNEAVKRRPFFGDREFAVEPD